MTFLSLNRFSYPVVIGRGHIQVKSCCRLFGGYFIDLPCSLLAFLLLPSTIVFIFLKYGKFRSRHPDSWCKLHSNTVSYNPILLHQTYFSKAYSFLMKQWKETKINSYHLKVPINWKSYQVEKIQS